MFLQLLTTWRWGCCFSQHHSTLLYCWRQSNSAFIFRRISIKPEGLAVLNQGWQSGFHSLGKFLPVNKSWRVFVWKHEDHTHQVLTADNARRQEGSSRVLFTGQASVRKKLSSKKRKTLLLSAELSGLRQQSQVANIPSFGHIFFNRYPLNLCSAESLVRTVLCMATQGAPGPAISPKASCCLVSYTTLED